MGGQATNRDCFAGQQLGGDGDPESRFAKQQQLDHPDGVESQPTGAERQVVGELLVAATAPEEVAETVVNGRIDAHRMRVYPHPALRAEGRWQACSAACTER